jgi:hypothetical protein
MEEKGLKEGVPPYLGYEPKSLLLAYPFVHFGVSKHRKF